MLQINGEDVSSVSLSALLALPVLQHACSSFLSELSAGAGTNQVPASVLPHLCLFQGEEAAVDAKQLPLVIGSQDATTCLITLVYCPVEQLVWCAHVDGQDLGVQDVSSLTSLLPRMQQPQLYLVGAYCNHTGAGPAAAQAFLQLMHFLPAAMQLRLCCIAAANTASDGSPRCCQLVLNTTTQTVHPWMFSDRGPEVPRRFAAQALR